MQSSRSPHSRTNTRFGSEIRKKKCCPNLRNSESVLFRSQAPRNCIGSRRTLERPQSNSPPTIYAKSKAPRQRSRYKEHGTPNTSSKRPVAESEPDWHSTEGNEVNEDFVSFVRFC